jgi:hypothetical protein
MKKKKVKKLTNIFASKMRARTLGASGLLLRMRRFGNAANLSYSARLLPAKVIVAAMVEPVVAIVVAIIDIMIVMHPAPRYPDRACIVARGPDEIHARAGRNITAIDDRSWRSDTNANCNLSFRRSGRGSDDSG